MILQGVIVKACENSVLNGAEMRMDVRSTQLKHSITAFQDLLHVQITAFVNEALQIAGLPTVDSKTAGKLIKEVHTLHFSEHVVFADLRLFDNAVWRYQGSK